MKTLSSTHFIRPQSTIFIIGNDDQDTTSFIDECLVKTLREDSIGMVKKISFQKFTAADDINDFEKLIAFPILTDYLIVETSGMSDETIELLMALSKKQYYELNVIQFGEKFELLDYEIVIKPEDYSTHKFAIQNKDYFDSFFLDTSTDYVIIGDVHGCFDELIELLKVNGFTLDEYNNILDSFNPQTGVPMVAVFVGDIVDKGDQIPECIEYVYGMLKSGHAVMTKGNHENFVFNYLHGNPSYLQTKRDFVDQYLSTVKILEKDEELKEKFFKMTEMSREFLSHPQFIVTHAPCKNEFVGKFDKKAFKPQRSFRFNHIPDTATSDEIVRLKEDALMFFKREGRDNLPYHVVGHVMTKNVLQFKNKIMIDTGCVSGGKLTSLVIDGDGELSFQSVEPMRRTIFGKEVVNMFQEDEKY